jgi:hypothetical protein
MRLHLRVRTVMIAIALLAGLLGTAAGIERRIESFKHLAAYHYQASSVLIDRAGGSLFCGTGLTDSDFERIFCGRGPDECLAYKASCYHSELADKYQMAANNPWLPVSNDPPPLPGTFPKFEVDPLYYDLVNGVNSGTGMK